MIGRERIAWLILGLAATSLDLISTDGFGAAEPPVAPSSAGQTMKVPGARLMFDPAQVDAGFCCSAPLPTVDRIDSFRLGTVALYSARTASR